MAGRVRSVLFLPASNARAIEKARALPCDVAVLDLEDAVAPDMKIEARAAAVAAARAGGFGPRLAVRINALDTPWGADDLTALRDTPVDLIVAPKVESAAAVRALSDAMQPDARLWAMIETPRAVVGLDEVASAGGALAGLMLGVNDLAKDLKTGMSPDREPLKPWLAAVVAQARANGLTALDGVFNRFEDETGFAAECAQGRLYGFDGKSLIHPRQIDSANAAFGPTTAEIVWAQKVVAAFAAPEAEALGVIQVEGEMVERLHLAQAQALLMGL
ncbi:MAG: CoA ester lyase [Brevundimonas sp.]|uniref:HpcH/HpaI aldolase/citrate lyase family protein n=1 Tax=Brevundimonas sp. TaxID=1871086 RepID=UPI0012249CDB|nr:CoA ester lyase [Brevundimonas sp.]RZJ18677.1 MAG: CoA ester lyase [Brevundimonas sp.]